MIFTVANQKGGQAKSTTAQALATGASARGLKALAIDLDPQCNLTFSFGGNQFDVGAYELLASSATANDVIQRTEQGDLIGGSTSLALADTSFIGDQRISRLKQAIRPVVSKYDVVVIDTPPTLGVLLINALVAADTVIIPMTADAYSLQGLSQLIETIRGVQSSFNPSLKIGGVLLTKHSGRTILSRDLSSTIREQCKAAGISMYKTFIREAVAVRESQMIQQSIFTYAPKSKPAKDYVKLLDEIGL